MKRVGKLTFLRLKQLGFWLPRKIEGSARNFKMQYQQESLFRERKIPSCENCHLTWVSPMPSSKEMEKYYAETFWQGKKVDYDLIGAIRRRKRRKGPIVS